MGLLSFSHKNSAEYDLEWLTAHQWTSDHVLEGL